MRLVLLAGAILLAVSSCGGTTSEVEPATTSDAVSDSTTTPPGSLTPAVTENVAYTVDQELDVYATSEPGPWPVVVVVHGYGGNRQTYGNFARELVSHGAVVFTIDVRMSVYDERGNYLTLETTIERVACAIRFARAKASDYGGDPARITLVGQSGGAASGIVVAMDGDQYDGDCAVNDGSALPDAFVGYEGPYDWSADTAGPLRAFAADPGMWEAIDPYSHIGGNLDLVVRLIHGDLADASPYDVPLAVSVEMYEALVAAGYDAELTVVPDASHSDVSEQDSEAFDVAVRQVLRVAAG